MQRKIAGRLVLPSEDDADVVSGEYQKGARLYRGHRLAPTAIALTSDDRTAFSVSKDGTIFKWDVETMSKTRLHRPGDKAFGGGNGGSGGGRAAPAAVTGGADWLKPAAREGSKIALYAAAVSSDGQFLAVGGGDKKVHVFDAKSGAYVQAYPGHKDLVSGLAFREGSHQLFSASFDRTVKIWSLDDRAYVDTLFGHQAELLAIDLLRSERAVTCGQDRSCRVWKVPEESQLIFRSHSFTQDCAKYVTGTDWLTGTCDGTLQLWSQMKKKPAAVVRGAHGPGAPFASLSAGCSSPDAAVSGWVQSVAVCRGSDLVASGAGDGLVRLWQLVPSAHSNVGGLECLGGLPVRGFVNSLAIARSGQFVLAGVGQEPRLGRWLRDGSARNGLVLHRLQLQE